jgi:cell division protein FtsI/penicillin-binding protein 2
MDLQRTAYDALADYNGAVVALDLDTGGVLVQVSKASFDPNLFVTGISYKDYDRLNNSKNNLPMVCIARYSASGNVFSSLSLIRPT